MTINLIHLLKPLEQWLNGVIENETLRKALFHVFRLFHLYLYEFPDYFLFALAVLPFFFLPKRIRHGYALFAGLGIVAYTYGWGLLVPMMLVPLLVFLALRIWYGEQGDKRGSEKQSRLRSAGMIGFLLVVYGVLVWRETTETLWMWNDRPILIPILHFCGIGFMLPKLIHVVVDAGKGSLPSLRLFPFFYYLFFFPMFRMGPIERYPRFFADYHHALAKGIQREDLLAGLWRISLGGVKTIVFAAWLWPFRQAGATHPEECTMLGMYAVITLGTLSAYLQFSGYSDIAIGFGRLLGFSLTENFSFPYFSSNYAKIWRRWHISMSFWLRDYLYIPLRRVGIGPYPLYFLTFIVAGLWHNFSFHWFMWGVLQGIGLSVYRLWAIFWLWIEHKPPSWAGPFVALQALSRRFPTVSWVLGVTVTLHYFAMTGVASLFTLSHSWRMFRVLLGLY